MAQGHELDTAPKTAFPRTAVKGDAEDDIDAETIGGGRVRRLDSLGSDISQTATIPGKATATATATAAATAAQGGVAGGRGRSKSRSRNAAKAAGQSQVVSGSSSSDVTIAELQQRLETMAREKVTLESAIELEQERMFNQSRRLSGTMSPAALLPVGTVSSSGGGGGGGAGSGNGGGGLAVVAGMGIGVGVGVGVGAVSPRWPRSHSRSSSVSSFGDPGVGAVGMTETLKADINSLRLRLADTERELVSCYNQSQIYKKELVSLRQRLGMGVDDLYLDDPVPHTIRPLLADHGARPRRSQSVSSGVSSSSGTPSLVRRGSGHQSEYFGHQPAGGGGGGGGSSVPAGGTSATPRRTSQRPRSVLLSPRRSMEDHHAAVDPTAAAPSLFAAKSSAGGPPHRASRNFK
ncbi:hypothetical protein GGI15_003729 [Coemansia interrupta]|uniref:Uncharacterized protein n=1 Tax=Coemansia interrupta TaxID=1126814 RepID=A0A9W8HCT7_9FUNG|nr:hypothetical protein GGI15_003729 [Coemansia interrupta]